MPLSPDDLAGVIADAIKAANAPLMARIAVLEAKGFPAAIVGEKGEPGPAGKDAEVDLDALVAKMLPLMPVPKDGKDGTAPDVEEIAKVAALLIPVPKDGAPGLDGKDGIGVAGAVIDKDGTLVLTLSDGSMKSLGVVVGRNGERGEAGLQGAPGANGINGKDGTLENIVPVYDGERTFSWQFKDGTPVEGWRFHLPMLLDRGVYSSEKAYEPGDVLSYGGSAWICKAACQGKQPGTDAGGPFWRLAVKRGNDGKPGQKGLDGKDGLQGPPGRDGTRSY